MRPGAVALAVCPGDGLDDGHGHLVGPQIEAAPRGTAYTYRRVHRDSWWCQERPVRGRGAGIFLHVNGRGATAGCVSVPKDAMRTILTWARPEREPHVAIGTSSGRTAITRY